MFTRKIFVHVDTPEEEGRNCPGCNWETGRFYRIGKEKIKPEDSERYGPGLCADCLIEEIMEHGWQVTGGD